MGLPLRLLLVLRSPLRLLLLLEVAFMTLTLLLRWMAAQQMEGSSVRASRVPCWNLPLRAAPAITAAVAYAVASIVVAVAAVVTFVAIVQVLLLLLM